MTVIIAHRGSAGTHPENTLPAFMEAVRTGADGIELDVHLTADQQLVVIHDESVDRTTDGKGLIRELTLEEIKELDAGSWFDEKYQATKISTLQEVLNLLLQMRFRGFLCIEIKTNKFHYPGIEEKISSVMTSKEWPFTYWYTSFNIDSLRILHEYEPDAQYDLIQKNDLEKYKTVLDSDFIEGVHPSYDWVKQNPSIVKEYEKAIRPWTPNLYETMMACFENKLAGIITDFPEKAIRARSRYNK
ncbi:MULTISPECIES: glycerophosphodiester phosphodiesterase [Enterococcus]|uniref:glycerophosphodiester phosphodiesterase n=1 Tax=Enterococcus TaxID=1350 RepID=UPI0008B8A97C|nr:MULTISPECIES: glycerophosphodiester phosphodiesterase [Enterococcus]BBM18770.1 glycerophosphodiester phosphodiesterase [Enterococcus avium]SET74285.1 glycerophosphoryl diester phosphodiesterase [Enterococcus malodoratus]HCM85687.1 glycerophosphodiester phosphodiesterase [Enterococcus sp.]